MTNKKVTEDDLRKEQYKGVNLESFEFDADGKPAHKKRFEVAIYEIAVELGLLDTNYYPDVMHGAFDPKLAVEAVKKIKRDKEGDL